MSVLSDVHQHLRSEFSMVESQWQSTRSQWKDAVGDRFEKEYWHELGQFVPVFLRELKEVDDTLEQALRSLDD